MSELIDFLVVLSFSKGGTAEFALCAYGPYGDGTMPVLDGIKENLDGTKPR